MSQLHWLLNSVKKVFFAFMLHQIIDNIGVTRWILHQNYVVFNKTIAFQDLSHLLLRLLLVGGDARKRTRMDEIGRATHAVLVHQHIARLIGHREFLQTGFRVFIYSDWYDWLNNLRFYSKYCLLLQYTFVAHIVDSSGDVICSYGARSNLNIGWLVATISSVGWAFKMTLLSRRIVLMSKSKIVATFASRRTSLSCFCPMAIL